MSLSSPNGAPPYHAGLHRLAWVTVATTLLLIFVGGVVTNTGSALAVPDWPTSFGYNMFLYPWSKMVGGIFYEHSHRLLGSLVGLLTVSLALWTWLVESRRWVKRMVAVALVAVIIQGVLGGMRVVLQADAIAIVHGCLAQAFLAMVVGLAVVTGRSFAAVEIAERSEAKVLRFRACATAAIFYLQIVFGAWLTHTGERLDLHLLFAGGATFAALLSSARILGGDQATAPFHFTAKLLLGLLALQLALGTGAAVVRFAAPGELFSAAVVLGFPILHRLTGAMLVATSMALAWQVGGATATGLNSWQPALRDTLVASVGDRSVSDAKAVAG